jgi:hypothetical protein
MIDGARAPTPVLASATATVVSLEVTCAWVLWSGRGLAAAVAEGSAE